MSEKKSTTKKYTNGEVTILWKPDLCIHSANCVNGLPEVFDSKKRPWIDPEGAGTQAIIDQVKKCPSGALSFYLNEEGDQQGARVEAERIVEVMPNGPLLVYGNITIKRADGTERREARTTAFCRCGNSKNKPFCDGTHRKIGFEG